MGSVTVKATAMKSVVIGKANDVAGGVTTALAALALRFLDHARTLAGSQPLAHSWRRLRNSCQRLPVLGAAWAYAPVYRGAMPRPERRGRLGAPRRSGSF
jgi:hypothetical protein